MKKITIYILLSLVLSFVSNLYAQDETDFSLGLNGMYGINSLQYEVEDGTHKTGWRPRYELETKIYFWDNMGIGLAIAYSKYSSKAYLNDYSQTTQNVIDTEGDLFDLNVEAQNLKEKNEAEYLEVPITFEYRIKNETKLSYLFSLGVMFSFHLNSETTTKADAITITADYNQWNAHLYDIPNHGLTSSVNWSNKYKDEFENSIGVVFQSGVDYQINDDFAITLGIFAHLGFNDCLNSKSNGILTTPTNPNSIVSTSDHVRLRTLGIKLGVKIFDSL